MRPRKKKTRRSERVRYAGGHDSEPNKKNEIWDALYPMLCPPYPTRSYVEVFSEVLLR